MNGRSAIEEIASHAVNERDPEEALRVLQLMRTQLVDFERARVVQALREGASWSRIGAALGISKQAAHRKYRDALERCAQAEGATAPGGSGRQRIRVTPEVRQCVKFASEYAREQGQGFVGTEHLLVGILSCEGHPAVLSLNALGITLERAVEQLRPTLVGVNGGGQPPRGGVTPHARRILESAMSEAIAMRDGSVEVEHLLLALLSDEDNGAVLTLEALGARPGEVREAIPASRAN